MTTSIGRWFYGVVCLLAIGALSAEPPTPPSIADAPRTGPATQESSPRSPALHVATYNIMGGRHVPGADERISAFLTGLRPDIVCLQEARWWSPTSELPSGHPGTIAKNLGGYAWCGAARHQPSRGTQVGMAIVTRGRILKHESLGLDDESPYGVLAEIEIDGVRLIVVSVHLHSLNGATLGGALSTEGARVRQVDHLVNRIKRETLPVIVAGDFNALNFFPSYGVLARELRDVGHEMHEGAYTRQTRGWPARIDYIFASDHFAIERYAVHPVDYSDHRPVTAELMPRATGPSNREASAVR